MVNPFIRCVETANSKHMWVLETRNTAYVFGLDGNGCLQHLYWGPKLALETDYGESLSPFGAWPFERPEGISQEEFPAWGDLKYSEPCLKATFVDGTRCVLLQYESYAITTEEELPLLSLFLQDSHYPLTVQLRYRIIPEYDLIERSAVLKNVGEQPIELEQIMSAAWTFPIRDSYRFRALGGKWGGEFQLQEIVVPIGKQVVESRRGNTSHQANPWFGLDPAGLSTETHGEVWFGALAFSGNWKFVLEKNAYGQVTLVGGINDFDFRWRLEAGETFETPSFVAGFTGCGYGEASRLMHHYQLNQVLPSVFSTQVRPVLYNSWYATHFDVNEENQKQLAGKAASLGVELFVVDDGWFGQRYDDTAGLGDWYVNQEKFPNGLNSLIAHVNDLGMDFGLWVEPEMVNPDSDLYRAHPEWVYHFPNRPRSEVRNQLVLNVARQDVREFIFGFMDDLLSQHNIRFIKWDMNRHFSEPGWPDAPEGRDREIWVRHARGVYELISQLRAKHPEVMFESCSGGGGRIDLGIMRYVEQFWMSDNTDAFDDLFIFEGYSLAYAPKAKMAWVTDPIGLNQRSLSLAYRFHSAMTGSLGIGGNLLAWSEADMNEAKDWISKYKEIRETIQHGYLYRLRSPGAGKLAAVQYVNQDRTEAVVLLFLHSSNFGPYRTYVQLQGLNHEATYRMVNRSGLMSGKALMHRGIWVEMRGDFVSQLIHIRQET